MAASDGVRLRYELVGDGPPLLLHLGAGCDSDLWRAAGYLEPLLRSYRCILFDHRGHGESDHPAGVAANHVDRFVADVVELFDRLAVESVAFWAYSSGISVGVKLAESHPSRVRCLIGSGVLGKPPTAAQLAASIAAAVATYREHGWEKLIAGFEADEGEVPEWMKQRIRATDIEPVIAWSEARLEWGWSTWEALPSIANPTLFLVGEYEDPDDTMAEAAALMPRGQRIRVPGKGHINGFLDSAFVLPHVEHFLATTTGD
jgi:pimeloyl-ACP methyl ester carboxylesterase